MNFFNSLLSNVVANSTLYVIVTLVGAGLGVIAVILDFRNERRARDTFGIERRRLSEVNLKLEHNTELAPVWQTGVPQSEQAQGAFMILRMPMENIGDGPIDVLGMLASARHLTYAEWVRGIGARSRDVEWDDYHASYWNEANLKGNVFAGISTTKSLISTANHFVRLNAKESGSMRRVDAIHEVGALQESHTLTVMYRVFAVARGYALGEILRQLGGGPPDPATNVRQELLQFQRLAQPDYRRWLHVQQALININRFAFRLAIFDEQDPSTSGDPLGTLATPDAWRIFLLHHWEFIDDAPDAAPEKLPPALKKEYQPPPGHMKRASEIAEGYFPDRRLPDVWDDEIRQRIARAQGECYAELEALVAAWKRLQHAIKMCRANDFKGDGFKRRVPKGCPWEGYPQMIHRSDEYRKRWYALMAEGFLVSKPFFRNRVDLGIIKIGGRRRKLDMHDIPADPRVLEPYVMRTYYFLDVLDAQTLDKRPPAPGEDR